MQPRSDPRTSGNLLQVLGIAFGLAVTVGNTIGAGILRTPGEIAAKLPDIWLILGVWLAGGFYALLGGNAIAELGTLLPRSGGQYVFAQRALGSYAGFVVGWSDWLSTCGTSAAVGIVAAEAITGLFGAGAGPMQISTVAVAVVLVFAFVQLRGVVAGAKAQEWTSLAKAIAFLILILCCFFLGNVPFSASEQPKTMTTLGLFAAIIIALQSVIYAYDGWAGVVYFSEEIRDPKREIPWSIFGSVAAVTLIYVFLNLAFFRVLPLSKIAGDPFPAIAVARTLFGPPGDLIIRGLIIVSLLSALNAYALMAPRVIYAMSRDGLFPSKALEVKRGTPRIAVAISTLVTILFMMKTFGEVIALLSFFFVANYTLSFLSLFVLRLTEPNLVRPFRAWGHPWTTGLALLGSVAFLVGAVVSDRERSGYALILLALSYPVFLVIRSLPGKTKSS